MTINSVISLLIAGLPLISLVVWLLLTKRKKSQSVGVINKRSLHVFLIMITVILAIPLFVLDVTYFYVAFLTFLINVCIPVFLKKGFLANNTTGNGNTEDDG